MTPSSVSPRLPLNRTGVTSTEVPAPSPSAGVSFRRPRVGGRQLVGSTPAAFPCDFDRPMWMRALPRHDATFEYARPECAVGKWPCQDLQVDLFRHGCHG